MAVSDENNPIDVAAELEYAAQSELHLKSLNINGVIFWMRAAAMLLRRKQENERTVAELYRTEEEKYD